jgi:ParB-like chromosome segregation protein Spo0J
MPMASYIELWPVERLIPYARNSRTHSGEQVAQIAASIKEFGFVNPILAGSDSVMIAGHGRLLAARTLGLTEVPVIIIDGLTDNQRRALILADNKLTLNAGWDEEMLRLEIEALRDADYDLNLIGFEDDELALLLARQEAPEGLTDEDTIPELQETPSSVSGDRWLLGEHRVLCGDATVAAEVERLMARDTADLVFTDPSAALWSDAEPRMDLA